MTSASIVPLLFLLTVGAVIAFALISQRRTLQRLDDPNAPKSTLAEDEGTPVMSTSDTGEQEEPRDGHRSDGNIEQSTPEGNSTMDGRQHGPININGPRTTS